MKKFFKTISATAFSGLCIAMLGAALVSCKPDEKGIDGANYTVSLEDFEGKTVAVKETFAITPTFSDPKAADLKYSWLSMDLAVLTVEADDEGAGATVTALKAGIAKVRIVCTTNPKLAAECNVEVYARTLTLDKGVGDNNEPVTESIFKGQTLTVTPTFGGAGTAALGYTWTATGDGIVSVTEGANNVGTVTGLKPGTSTVTITCDTDSDLKASFAVEVKAYAITLTPNGGTLRKNGTLVITPAYNDPGAGDFDYTWESDDESVATVEKNADGTATVTGVGDGYALITVTCDDDATLTASCTVQVETWSVSLGTSTETIEVGRTATITPTFNPATASSLTYDWTKTDEVSLVVSNNGTVTVTGVSAGTATITITAEEDPTITNQITLTVTPALGDIFAFDKVWVDGTAVSAKTEIAATLENPDVFAWYGDLTAGTLTLPMELASVGNFIAPKDDSATFAATTEDAVEDAKLSETAVEWTIPSPGKYRVVINKADKTLAVYSPEIDLQPLTVEWPLDGVTQVTTITTLWKYGNSGWNWVDIGFSPSMADPQILIYNSTTGFTGSAKFGVTNVNASYTYTSPGKDGNTYNVAYDTECVLDGGSDGFWDGTLGKNSGTRNTYFGLSGTTRFAIINIREMTAFFSSTAR